MKVLVAHGFVLLRSGSAGRDSTAPFMHMQELRRMTSILSYHHRRRALARHLALDRIGAIRGIIDSWMKELAFAFTNLLRANGKRLQERYVQRR